MNNNLPRRSGKTFRALLEALYTASNHEKRQVYYLVSGGGSSEVERVYLAAINILMCYIPAPFYTTNRKQHTIYFKNASQIEFMTVHRFEDLKGRNDDQTRYLIED